MKRSHKLAVIVLLQIVFLFSMIGFKHYTLQWGTPVLLQTAPVDPWDMFRGEYVILGYQISRLPKGDVESPATLGDKISGPVRVYVVLEQRGKFWEAVSIHEKKPDPAANQVFIKGDLTYFDPYNEVYFLRYGIESYYVPEGEGKILERQENLEVKVRVDRFGNAAIETVTTG